MSSTMSQRWPCLVMGLMCLGLVAGCGKSSRSEPAADLVKKLNDPNWEVRAEAAEQLRIRAPEGKEALPRLFEMLDDEHERCRMWASDALAVHGEDAYPLLVKGYKSESAHVRAMSWKAIACLSREVKGAHADEFATMLEVGLNDKEVRVRHFAAYAFNVTDMLSPKSIPIAISHLKPDENKMVLCYILDALTKCPEDVRRSALPQLREMAKMNDTEVRGLTSGLLVSLGEPNPNPPPRSGGGPGGPRGESTPAPPRKPTSDKPMPPEKTAPPDKPAPPPDKNR